MSGLYVWREAIDVLEVDGEALLLLPPDQGVRLFRVATAVFNHVANATTLNDLAAHMEERSGPPADGDTQAAPNEVLQGLVAAGVLEHMNDV